MPRGRSLLLVAVLLTSPAGAISSEPKRTPVSGAFLEGWDDFVLDGHERPGLVELRLHVSGEGWDNLRQSPSSVDPERTAGARTEARLTYRPFTGLPLKTHLEAGRLAYRTRSAMAAYGGGVALEGDRHTLHLGVRLERNRPSVDIGVGGNVTHDARLLRVRYALRTKRVEWWAGGDRAQQRYADAAFRDGVLQAAQTGVSIPGLARGLTPELVLAWSANDVPGDSDLDWQQRRAQLGLRYAPTRAVVLTARFELSSMGWGVTRPGAVNFAREDRRQYWGLQGQVRLTRQAAWTIVYDRLASRSTRANRGFTADYVSAALTFKLGSTSSPSRVPSAPRPDRPALVPAGPRTVSAAPTVASPALAPMAPTFVPAMPATVGGERAERVAVVEGGAAGVTRIEAVRRGEETETTIRGEGLLRYSTLELDGPARFVVDLVGVAAAPRSVAIDTPLVRGIRVAAFRTTPERVARVVFDLKAPVAARVEREGDTLRISLRPLVSSASAASR